MLDQICLIIGASHAGVNCAFALRKEGWKGKITLFDADRYLPYHRPPLSKAFLTKEDGIEKYQLKPLASYEKEEIELALGIRIDRIDRQKKQILANDGRSFVYDKLVLATGAAPLVPPIKGLSSSKNVFPLRNAKDVLEIKACFEQLEHKKVVIIGGGYIGLEIAASLVQLDAKVTLIEREERLLARVTSPEVSAYFETVHLAKGVNVRTAQEVLEIKESSAGLAVICKDQAVYEAEMIIYGVGIRVNDELASQAGLEVKNGIVIDEKCATTDSNIFAIGDNAFHQSLHYKRHLRLESVQNAVDQAKIAAKAICGLEEVVYDTIPWFWSDQYELKLQMVGLIDGYNEVITRKDLADKNKRSTWFFKDEELLAVQAVNDAKAYVYGTKLIKERAVVNKDLLRNEAVVLDLRVLLVC